MKEGFPVLMKESAAQGAPRLDSKIELELGDPGIVVLDGAGQLVSASAEARRLLKVDSKAALDGRVKELRSLLHADLAGSSEETTVAVPGVGSIGVRVALVSGASAEGQVLLLREGRAKESTTRLLQDAARHRAFTFLARDWAHDLKGMLHVIRINTALLGRLMQRSPGVADPAVTKCLDAIPREIERLDRSIELMFGTKVDEQPSLVDVGRVCERLRTLIAGRATRQRVEVVLEIESGPKEIVGFEHEVQLALLNILLNALEAMPEQGRLVISGGGGATGVMVRVSDTGAGMTPQPDDHKWHARFVKDRRGTAIGLHVASAIVASHNGRIECASNVPRGTSVEITFPSAASTERLRHGSRTHR